MSQTTENLLPAVSGQDLGNSPSQEWDVFAQDLSISGPVTLFRNVGLAGQIFTSGGPGSPCGWTNGGGSITSDQTSTETSTVITAPTALTRVVLATAAADIVLNLPVASTWSERFIYIKKVDSGIGVVQILPASGTIDGFTGYNLTAQYDYVVLYSDASSILIFGSNA